VLLRTLRGLSKKRELRKEGELPKEREVRKEWEGCFWRLAPTGAAGPVEQGPAPEIGDGWTAGLELGRLLALGCLLSWLWSVFSGADAGGPTLRASCPAPRLVARSEAPLPVISCDPQISGGMRIGSPERLLFGLTLNVNVASAAALEVLPGIGPGRARGILETRLSGSFESLEDLARVRGIGPRTIEGLRGWAHAGLQGKGSRR
jgi:hypothetical protein